METLEVFYKDVLAHLPVDTEARIVLNGAMCARPPDEIETAQLKVIPWPLGHDYGDSARYDLVNFFADKTTYRRLGLSLFSSMFHSNREITLHLRHPETKVAKIRLGCPVSDPLYPGLIGLASTPQAFGYEAVPVVHLHPLWGEDWRIDGATKKGGGRGGYHFPFFDLTNETGRSNGEGFASRNIVAGFGGAEETATLAALLLDLGLPQTELNEICLESPSGNWSVAIGSAEARFWVGYEFL